MAVEKGRISKGNGGVGFTQSKDLYVLRDVNESGTADTDDKSICRASSIDITTRLELYILQSASMSIITDLHTTLYHDHLHSPLR